MSEQNWEKIAKAKQAALAESIPSEYRIPKDLLPPDSQLDVTTWPKQSGWFSQKELEITGSTASEILQKIASKAWSSEDVTKAFCKRAAAAQQLTNCLSDAFFNEAIKSAKALDDHLQRTGNLVGPLHGLPISLKDNFNIKGKDSTVGFTSLVNKPAEYNATLVDILQELGAVRYCKTNVPTAMMIAESVNNTFGRTVNPLNRALTSGGSSGGESALIAFGGSPLGVGTDIGGSLRIPAACTGIFTLRPSHGRFTTQRCRSGLAGQEAVKSVNGPMGRTLEDIAMYSKAVIDAKPWLIDPTMLPMPWQPAEQKQKLKIAVMWNDAICLPTPPVARALKETVQKLKNAGHELVEWDPKPLHPKILQVLVRLPHDTSLSSSNCGRVACSWQTAVRASKLFSHPPVSHGDQRCRCTQTPPSSAYTTCGSCNSSGPNCSGNISSSGCLAMDLMPFYVSEIAVSSVTC